MGDVKICNITITSQADIDSGSLFSCPIDQELYISIRDATGVLNFTNLTNTYLIDVADSSRLQVLDFPQLQTLGFLAANGATNLSSISLNQVSSPPPEIYPNGDYSLGAVYLNITGSPSLMELDLQDAAGLHGLILKDVSSLSWDNPNITSVVILESSTCLRLSALASVRNLHLTGSNIQDCFVLPKLESVLNFTMTSIGPYEISFGQTPLTVTDTLILESSMVDPDYVYHTVEAGPVASVGGNAFVTSNANAHINFDSLGSVKGNLSISNNRNCSFNFDHLGDVDSLLLTDNLNTPVPSFPSLLRANNIHVRGYIKTANIFPALVSVSDIVNIEAWNADFNCSRLTAQHQAGSINQLSCNGTDNGTQPTQPTPTSSPSLDNGLTQGAKAGIGVGVVFGILGAGIVLVWLVLRFRIQRKGISRRGSIAGDTAATTTQESGGIHEKQGDDAHEVEGLLPAHQADGQMVIQESPGDEIYELPSVHTELHGDNSVLRSGGRGVRH